MTMPDGKRDDGVWVCGTDTGVGKTVVASGLVRALSNRGERVVGLKPLVTGWVQAPEGLEGVGEAGAWEDLERIGLAGGVALTVQQRAVYRLRFPAAPAFSAAMENQSIDPRLIRERVLTVAASGSFAVVEGVGGFRVPLAAGYDTADLARDLAWPALLVVGVRLGCINHALLTGEALAARGIPLLGWVANLGVDREYPHKEETIAVLERGLGMPCAARLGALPGGRALVLGSGFAAWRAEAELQISVASLALDNLACQLGVRAQGGVRGPVGPG